MSHWEACGRSDEWYTPKHIFDALGCHFDLDVAAPLGGPLHVPCDGWIHSDSLLAPWSGFVWMNPPFGGRNSLGPWLDKFFAHGNGIALTPDRTSAPWFQAAWDRAHLTLFTPKLKFIRPDGSTGNSPSTGTCLFAAGSNACNACNALRRAHSRGLGILGHPIGRVAA